MAGGDARHPQSRPRVPRADHGEDSRGRSAAVGADARRRHYAAFYGLEPLPQGRPLAVAYGNCQAESLRVALEGPGLHTVRVPPVHELTAADVPHLCRVLGRAAVLVAQPVRDDYRNLPLGTHQVARLIPRGARVVRVPVIRFAGLYPTHAIIRPPSDPSLVPPLVAYHDLLLLAHVARLDTAGVERPLAPTAVRAISELSLRHLQARERVHRTLIVSDLFATPSFAQMRTLNHPGNAVWTPVAQRVRDHLRLPAGPPPARPLLNAIHAPREAAVIAAFGLDDEPRSHWLVDGRPLAVETVRAAHLDWYRAHPDAVKEGVRRHSDALQALLAP